jgi:hypothetical protein
MKKVKGQNKFNNFVKSTTSTAKKSPTHSKMTKQQNKKASDLGSNAIR